MPSISTTPAYPVPGKPCKVRVTATNGGTAIRIWCTDAPRGSAFKKKLTESGASRVAFVGGPIESGKDFDFTPDKGGGYALTLDELFYDKPAGTSPGFGGGYEGDVRGAKRESIRASASVTLLVAKPFTHELGAGGDKATLTLFAYDQFIIPTDKATHGAATPAITSTTSPRAAAAAETSSVRDAVAALAEITSVDSVLLPPVVSAITGFSSKRIGAVISRFQDKFDKHTGRTQSHEQIDGNNVTPEYLDPIESEQGQSEALSKLFTALDGHIRNSDPGAEENPGETGSAELPYHAAIGWAALPRSSVRPGTSAASIAVAAAEWWRAFSAHLADEAAHVSVDDANKLGTPTPLMALHLAFLTELASTDPTAPATEHVATPVLLAAGFKEP